MKRIALLSNVNMNFVIRMLQKETEVYETEGYGNELGILMNPNSSYHAFMPEVTFLVMDLMELLEHNLEEASAEEKIVSWFAKLSSALLKERIYYVSDAYLWGVELSARQDTGIKHRLENIWYKQLEALCRQHGNVRILPYHRLLEQIGETNAFSMKMWYMGKILLSNQAQKDLCELILEKCCLEKKVPKKVLLLDLDNTLWGGLAGEAEHTPITLSEEHSGLAYKNLQRVILQMQRQGVLLGIVSKNNVEDAKEVLCNHPHMVLRPEDFCIQKINWKPKHENILEIAEELNLGLDSFVFFDDNPTERQLIKEMLKEVTVPDFPTKPEELAPAMVEIYKSYFARVTVTEEDLQKTRQYADNVKRNALQEVAGSFEEYLKQLAITIERVEPDRHVERLTQLVNKTNQFNLTTRRYSQTDIQRLLADDYRKIYLYKVTDRFGDNGIVAVVIVELADHSGKEAAIEEFAMSCRVMGKNIEHAIITDVEKDLRKQGVMTLRGSYLPTAKNKPVATLYGQLGYEKVAESEDGGITYQLELSRKPQRSYFVEWKKGEAD
ncbi:MAG: HAD-IIIC family phosphatase [Lachnospiraceae bacterium]|nr:HAD-IIIC family phosphatase [Lachnospiraceae bacterium]